MRCAPRIAASTRPSGRGRPSASSSPPWARLRQAQKLLRLAERYGPDRINAACAQALAFELLDVGRVEAIVRTALKRAPADGAGGRVVPLPGRFARAPESFTHPFIPQEDPDDAGPDP